MDIKNFIERTLEDTIGFLQVHIRMLEVLRDRTEEPERAAGIQEAIDVLNDSCEKGRETSEDYINRRAELLQKKMNNEAEEAGHPAVEACGKPMDKKAN